MGTDNGSVGPGEAKAKVRKSRSKKAAQKSEEAKASENAAGETDFLTSADQLPERELTWMLHPYLPLGNVVALTGPVNVGKSSFIAAVVADATGGPRLDAGQRPRKPAAVLYFVVEEDPALLVRPRLIAAEANLSHVKFPGFNGDGRMVKKLCLPRDSSLLEGWIKKTAATVVVFDPVNSFLDEGLEGTRTEHVRPMMDGLAAIAAATSCLMLAVLHQRKSKDGSALDWVAGSAAWVQCARMVLALGQHPNDEKLRVLAVSKPGIIKDPPSRLYSLRDKGTCGQFVLGSIVDVDAGELAGGKADKVTSWKRDHSKLILREELDTAGKPVKQILERCRDLGISEATVHRAARELNVPTSTRQEGEKRVTYWHLPEGGFPA